MSRAIAKVIGLAMLMLCTACTSLPSARQGAPDERGELAPSDAHARAALRLLQSGDWQAALSRAVLLDDTDGAAFHLLAVPAYHANDLGTALWGVRKAADLLPQNAGVLRGAAVIHAALGMRDQADDFSSRFARTAPDARDLADLTKTLDRW